MKMKMRKRSKTTTHMRENKINFHSSILISDSLKALNMKHLRLNLNMPIYTGACILLISKLIMMNFHYNVFKKTIPESKLCYMDTDSFIYEILMPSNDKNGVWDKLRPLAEEYIDTSV